MAVAVAVVVLVLVLVPKNSIIREEAGITRSHRPKRAGDGDTSRRLRPLLLLPLLSTVLVLLMVLLSWSPGCG